MQRYEIATLSTTIGAAAQAGPAIEAWAKAGKGKLLGVLASDIGLLNQILVLRGFESEAELAAERARAVASASPFNAQGWLTALSMDSYIPFPNIPPIATGKRGPVYEVRSYIFKTGGLQPTLDGWAAQLPGRVAVSPLGGAMYKADGAPGFTHIWPYPSLNDRAAIRADVVARGIWPPKGGPDCLHEMRSTICLPLPVSPLQ